jgi:fatty-acyl-CoA synthase
MSLPIHEVTQAGLLARLAAEYPDREALVCPQFGVRMTFAELDAAALRIARGLVALGLEPGERIAIWSDNRPEWIPLQFAAARAGCVLVTANTALARDEIAYLLRHSRSAMIVAAAGMTGREFHDAIEYLGKYDGVLPHLRHTVTLEPDEAWRGMTFAELEARGEEVDPEVVFERERAIAVDDPVNIQYTSGTTGFPKGVVLTNRNLVENAFAISRRLGVREDDRLLVQVPLFHCFGCVVAVLGAYTHGNTLVTLRRFDPAASLETVEAERCSLIYGVPTMFLAMLEHASFGAHDLSSLRAGIMGGAMCPEPLMRRVIDEMGCEGMLVAYGLTEASPGITSSRPSDPIEVRCGTVGTALDGVEVRIVDPETGAEVETGVEGELQSRGPNIMQGYFDQPEATAEAIIEGGWLRTGDLATRDEHGRFRIVGRLTDLIIRGGENVYPAEVEDALRAHPTVQDAIVFGIPSERFGEDVAAAVIPAAGVRIDVAELLLSLRYRLAPFKRPVQVAVVKSFPQTASGKVQRFRLAEEHGPNTPSST